MKRVIANKNTDKSLCVNDGKIFNKISKEKECFFFQLTTRTRFRLAQQ
jgi:hypothetical protein